jgi:hypothetical protein
MNRIYIRIGRSILPTFDNFIIRNTKTFEIVGKKEGTKVVIKDLFEDLVIPFENLEKNRICLKGLKGIMTVIINNEDNSIIEGFYMTDNNKFEYKFYNLENRMEFPISKETYPFLISKRFIEWGR